MDDEGLTCLNSALTAKRFVADDGTSAVCVWNMASKPVAADIAELENAQSVHAPDGTAHEGPMDANSLRLFVFDSRYKKDVGR